MHPVNATYLHAVTLGTMILGCTGMMLSRELKSGGVPFLIVEADHKKVEAARALGYLALDGDGTEEGVLKDAGIDRARALATVLPNDAANVFITLSARGEMPATEGKLRQAGADHVVLPAHIGAERVAQVILYPETARLVKETAPMQRLDRMLRGIGLGTDVVVVPDKGALTGLSIAEIEAQLDGRSLVVQIMRKGGEVLTRPDTGLRVKADDGVIIVGRGVAMARSLFEAPAASVRAGRQVFPGS